MDVQIMPTTQLTGFAGVAIPKTALQIGTIMLLSQVAGSTFGLWQGLGSASFSAAAFIDVHQALVRGLNLLLPMMAAAAIVFAVALAWLARQNKAALRFYLLAIFLAVAAGVVTRFGNQTINAQVMEWTVDTIPADWTGIRETWWRWHIIRTIASIGATVCMILAIFSDRSGAARAKAK